MWKRGREDDDDHSELRLRKKAKCEMPFPDLGVIPNEVLIRTFEGLDAVGLFNLTKADLSLIGVVKNIISRRPKDLRVNLYLAELQGALERGEDEIWVNSIQTCQQFIQLFSKWIYKLKIHYSGSHRLHITECVDFHRFLATQCAQTLEEFSMWDFPNNANNTPIFDRAMPFIQVHSLSMFYGNWSGQLPLISTCFPSVVELFFQETIATNFAVEFANLTTLSIDDIVESLHQYVPFFQSNPALLAVYLDAIIPKTVTLSNILDLLRNNPDIRVLRVRVSKLIRRAVTDDQARQLILQHPRLQTLVVENHNFHTDAIMRIVENTRFLRHFRCYASKQNKTIIRREIEATFWRDESRLSDSYIDLKYYD